ncbi:hypothetical protein [Cohnella sp. WQ 127256]|uniref:hypothetical protein n=1 Tax=Cohnella sp. WQ 127256 TaxID=2938790 RepID=UPI0021186722|nr:hypothetical protein [Cohnella sp. WQ 127256]
MSANKADKATKVKGTHGTYFIEERYEIIGGVRYDFLSSPGLSTRGSSSCSSKENTGWSRPGRRRTSLFLPPCLA